MDKKDLGSSLSKLFIEDRLRRVLEKDLDIEDSEFIGEGGQAIVYTGILDKRVKVAVKEITNLNPQMVLNEIEINLKIAHKGIPKLHGIVLSESNSSKCSSETASPMSSNSKSFTDTLEVDETEIQEQKLNIKLIFDYIEDHDTLCSLLDNENINEEQKVKVLSQLVGIVDYLHSNDIVHRDLNPRNILINSQSEVFLIDYGLGEVLLQRELSQRSSYGVIRYTPPESFSTYDHVTQRFFSDISFKYDIWSLGCIMIYIFTGKPPWEGFTENEIKTKLYNEESVVYESTGVQCEKIRTSIEKCINPDKNKRWGIQELRKFFESECECECGSEVISDRSIVI